MSMLNGEDMVVVNQITIEKMKVAAQGKIGSSMLHDMRVDVVEDFMMNGLLMNLQTNVLTQDLVKDKYTVEETKKISYPKNWWQHFKADVMPAWFLNRFPVQYHNEKVHFSKTIHITRKETYPMSSLVIQQDRQFMYTMGSPVIKDIVEGL